MTSTSVTTSELHWLDVPERVKGLYKAGVMMYCCMARNLGTSPTLSPQHLKSLLGFVCVPQTDTSLSYLVNNNNNNNHHHHHHHHTTFIRCHNMSIKSLQGRRRSRTLSLSTNSDFSIRPPELRDPACGLDVSKQFLKAMSTLSQKIATIAVFSGSRTFLRQCGQGLRHNFSLD